MNWRAKPALRLPAASRARIVTVCAPSCAPSRTSVVVSVKLPALSKLSVCRAPPSTRYCALATPERLSSSWPVRVRLALVAAPLGSAVLVTVTVGACVSSVSAKRASTASATLRPRAWPAWLENSKWMPP